MIMDHYEIEIEHVHEKKIVLVVKNKAKKLYAGIPFETPIQDRKTLVGSLKNLADTIEKKKI